MSKSLFKIACSNIYDGAICENLLFMQKTPS